MHARAALLALTLAAPSLAHAAGALHTDGAFFRDRDGAVVILRGVNGAGDAKVPDFRPLADPALLDPLPRWGLNVIRLLFTWEAYEPSPGAYDDGYLAYYRATVRAASDRGLSVIVDFHQDAFSRASLGGCGEGFPAWAIPPGIAPAPPDNGPACTDWGPRMLSDSTLRATWDGFYANAGGARDRYLAMIARVAAALVDEPGVIGYDLLNEPGGDEPTQIAALHADAGAAIRRVDPAAILFLSPAAVTSAGLPTRLPRPSLTNVVYAPHYYDGVVFTLGAWRGEEEGAPFDTMQETATAWGAPLFVGEYGASPSVKNVDGYLGALTAELDRRLASGAQWAYTPGWTEAAKDGWNHEDYSIVDDTGRPRANFRPRPFPRRVAGTPTAFEVRDASSGGEAALTLTWRHDPAIGATEIVAPPTFFGPSGARRVEPEGDVTCAADGELVVRCTAPTAGDKRVRVVADPPRCGLTGGEGLLLVAIYAAAKRRRKAARLRPPGS
jgi:endoglycosylceramidase